MIPSRTTTLCLTLSMALLLSSCTRDSAAAGKSPDAVARAFVAAVHAGEKERALSFLTEGARKGLESGSGFQLEDGKFSDAVFGATTIRGDEAEVSFKVKEDGRVQDLALLLRKGDEPWRVYGARITTGQGGTMTVDFEQFSSTASAIGEAMAAEFRTAFEQAARERAAQQIVEKKKRFEALRAISPEAYESRWKNDKDFRGAPAARALTALAKSVELGFHAGEHAGKLSAAVDVDVRGISFLEAIEKITGQLGLHPQYPSAQHLMMRPHQGFGKAFREALSDSSRLDAASPAEMPEEIDPVAITLASGPRDLPVQFAGPYLIELTELVERVPHGTGAVTVTARSFGYDPGVFLLMEDYGEVAAFGRLVDHKDRSLRAQEDVRYYGAGLLVGGVYEDTTNIELRRLLREVKTIGRLNGLQRLVLPVAVEEVRWKKLTKGARKQIGDLSIEIRQVGSFTSFNVRGPEATVKNLTARFQALDADGEEIEILGENSMQSRPDTAQASVQTSSTPASLVMKLVTRREVLEYPFTFTDIPLRRHAEQPEKVEPLLFAGFPAPVEVEFIRFEDREADFPKIRVRARNHSNKDALDIQATLHYLGDGGKTLKEFPQTLTGTFDAQGHHPVAARQAENEVEATAFFMPKETTGLRVVVAKVGFVDGTTWEPAE